MPENEGFENKVDQNASLPMQSVESGDDAAVQAMLEGDDGAGVKLNNLLGNLDK